MTTSDLYPSTSSDMSQTQESSVKPTTFADATFNTTETRYFTKDTTDQYQHQQQQQCHHQQQLVVPELPSMAYLPELILSSWLQSEYNQTQSPIIIQPIHHTLENATITYDTLVVEQQKELVKDVFFSPAMSSTNKSTIPLLSSTPSVTLSPSARTTLATPSNSVTPSSSPSSSIYASTPSSSSCSDDDTTTLCGSQTDGESLEDDFSPSDLLLEQDDASLFFCALDLELEQQQLSPSPSVSSPSPCSSSSSSLDASEASAMIPQHSSVLKRKRKNGGNGAPLLPLKRSPWLGVISPKSTPPMSPNEYRWDYFDASGEDSSTDDDTASTSNDYRTMKTDFQFISMQDADDDDDDDDHDDDDNDSSSFWENRRANMFDDREKTNSSKNKLTKLSKRKMSMKQSTSTTVIKKRKQNKKPKTTASTSTVIPPLESHDHLEKTDPRPTCHPTLYQKLTKTNVDWCRYCGTTEGVNWRPGPWGKRTLCNKHGCDYKGYGFACKLPRLNLTGYVHESLHDRDRPVLQFYCATCHQMESWDTNVLVRCEGCYKSYHQKCYHGDEQPLTDAFVAGDQPWYCEETCRENVACGRVVVEISRKRLPLMCAPTKNQIQASLCNSNNNNNNNTNSHRSISSSTDRATRNTGVGREANR
ncbi:hypothetical protein BCR42DRAFT_491522 [Absidia repens]|uniref:Zinc finger PHD-type domain-containing protein n=1 Tax=Absidia repens TaxID=90262 RepID=A0A1X2IH50_9FUNG|nr:hypothetical protein BCR42DRAFT_491522 [Absidia repens]